MSLPGSRGLRAAGGMRAAWERQQQAATLAAAAGRILRLAASKPAFFSTQLHAVLAALQHLHHTQQQQDAAAAGQRGREEESGGRRCEADSDGGAGWQTGVALAAAAAHLRRLASVDEEAGANAVLLLWLLLELAGRAELLPAPSLLPLLTSLGWHGLLLEAQPLVDNELRQQLQAGLLAAAAAAADGGSSAAQQQPAVQQLVAVLAGRLERQLQQFNGCSSSSSGGRQALTADIDLLQQLLLLCPAAAAAPATAAAMHQLQAAADACTPRLMQALQQQGGAASEQALFQQVCQLRARLMLALAGTPAVAAGSFPAGSSTCGCVALAVADRDDERSAAQAWRAVLHMPTSVPAAAATSAEKPSRPPNQLEFLAARVAAHCCLQASPAAGPSGGSAQEGGSSIEGSVQLESSVPALPGVLFLPLHPLGPGRQPPHARSRSSMAAAAEEAAAEVAADADCMGPAHLVLASLQLAEHVSAGPDGAAHPSWPALMDLAAAAAGAACEPAQQRALLAVLLHGQQPWQGRLRGRLAGDTELQQRYRRDLVAVLNRLSADGGAGDAAVVHGEARRRRAAAAVAALLPHALLCPAVVLERLLGQALVSQGEQVAFLLDVLHEMRGLALFCSPSKEGRGPADQAEQPLLLAMLAGLLAPEGGTQQQRRRRAPVPQPANTLDQPGSKQALVQLVAGLCGLGPDHGKPTAALPGTDGQPLFSPVAVLQHVVLPALEGHQAGLAQRGRAVPSAASATAAAAVQGLHLPLQLAELLVGSGPAASSADAGGAHTAASQAGDREARQLLAPLLPLLQGLLDFEARRVDRSSIVLEAGSSTFELAASLLRRLDSGAGRGAGAGAYFHSQLQPFLLPRPGLTAAQQQQHLAQQQVQHLRHALLKQLAALLPCCTADDAREVLHIALPTAIQSALMPSAAPGSGASSGGAPLPGAHAAAVEAACRAARVLALQPINAPLAGEDVPASAPATGAPAAAVPPSALRRAAVERVLQHLTQCCARLAAPASPSTAPPTPVAEMAAGEAALLQLGPAERQALALRCFRELCQLAAALEPAGYDCCTLQACLLQVAASQIGRQEGAVRAAEHHSPPAGLLPAQHVQEHLAAEAGALPKGRLREVVLLAVEAGQL